MLCLLRNEVFPLFDCVPLCFVWSSEGRKEGMHHLSDSWQRLEGVSSAVCGDFFFLSQRRSSAGDVPLSARSPACVSNP